MSTTQSVVSAVGPASDEGADISSTSQQVRKAAVDGVRWFSLSSGVAQLLGTGSAVVLARLIAPSEFGRLAVAMIVNEFALMTANETIGTPLVQRANVEYEHLEAATLVALLLGLGLAGLTFFAIPLLTTPLFGSQTTALFRLFAPAFLIAGFLIVPLARLQRSLRFGRIGIGEVIATPVSAGVAVALAFAGLGAKAYVLGILAGLITMTVVYVTATPPVRPRWHPRHMREILRFGAPAVAAGFAGVWYRNIDYMILGVRLPAASVGFYYRAFTLGVEYERRLSGIVARVAFPLYARTDDPAERLALRQRIVRVNVAVVYPMLALFIATAPILVPWLFGDRWAPAVLPAQILAVAGMASCVRSLTGPTVLAAGRPHALFVFSMAETVLYGATVWVAGSYSLVTVCIAVSTFQIASLLIAYTVLLRSAVGVPRSQILRDLGPAVLASTAMFLAGTLLTRALGHELPAATVCLIVGAGGGAMYLLALRWLSAPSWDDLTRLVRRVLPSRIRKAAASASAS
jgi:O-antigen/teichoic acid export membrane protein